MERFDAGQLQVLIYARIKGNKFIIPDKFYFEVLCQQSFS